MEILIQTSFQKWGEVLITKMKFFQIRQASELASLWLYEGGPCSSFFSLSLYTEDHLFFSFFFSCLLEVHSSHGIRYTYPLLNLSKGIQQLFQKESWNSIKMDHWSWVHPWTFSDYGYKNETCWLVQAIQGYSCTEDSEMSDGLSQNKIWLLFEREKEGTEF